MTNEESNAVQGLVSAAVRVVRTPMTGVDPYSPMARAVLGLAIQLAAAGIIRTDEAIEASQHLPTEAVEAETGRGSKD